MLKAFAELPEVHVDSPPCWLSDEATRPDPRFVIPCRDCLVSFDEGVCVRIESTPDFFADKHRFYLAFGNAGETKSWADYTEQVFRTAPNSARNRRLVEALHRCLPRRAYELEVCKAAIAHFYPDDEKTIIIASDFVKGMASPLDIDQHVSVETFRDALKEKGLWCMEDIWEAEDTEVTANEQPSK